MKKLFLLLLGVTAFSFFGCHNIRIMTENIDKVQVTNPSDIIEVHADSFDVDFQTVIPKRYFNKKAIMKIEPQLIVGKDTTVLEPLYAAGEKVDSTRIFQARVPFKSGATVPYHKKVAYKKGMKDANLNINYSFKMDSKYEELQQCASNVKTKKASNGLVTTSQTVKNTDDLQTAGSYEPVPIQKKATIYYQIDRWKIWDSSAKKPEVTELKDVVTDPRYVITNISFRSAASPDGPLAWNTKLAKERNNASTNYILNEFRKVGFNASSDSSFIKKDRTPEDWEGFKYIVQNSDMNVKNDIISIANSNLPPDVKERNIKKLGNWKTLTKTYLPSLRKSTVTLFGETRIRKFDELKKLYDMGDLEEFNKPELLLFAYNSDNLDEKMKVYNYYNDKYPNEWIAKNNIAFVYLMKGEGNKAIDILKKLNEQYPDNKEILNNIGVCYRWNKDYSKALEYFRMAKDKGIDVRNNTAITDINLAKYDEAVKMFEPERCDYNKALAFTLNKDYTNALNTIDCIEDKTADDYYLRAIVAARQNDLDLLTTSLSRAVKLDSNIRKRAQEDYEFQKYWKNMEFLNSLR